MRPRITASLIVKNEARFLPGCLDSIAKYVDEIIVVDTGSTDDTVAIAHRHGAKVIHYKWHNDFSAARNAGLDRVATDWVLYIDADERLSLPEGRSLTDSLDQAETFAGRPLFFPRVGWTPYRELRVFRSHPALRFSHAMHETIVPAFEALRISQQVRSVDIDATIEHLGYEGDQTHKNARNLPLLRAAVRAYPDRLYFWHHLSETLNAMGDGEAAIAACREGLQRASARRSVDRDSSAEASIYVTAATVMRSHGIDCLDVVEQGLKFYPENRALRFFHGRELFHAGRFSEALAIANQLRFEDGPDFIDREMAFDKRIFGAYADELAGLTLLGLGRRDEAAAAFARAARSDQSEPAYRIKALALGRGTFLM